MESIKKRDLWTDREIRSVLSIVHEKHILKLMDGKTRRNKSIFEDIANELKKKNILKSHVQVRNKFKSLKSDFYKAKRNNNESGAKRQTSEHFELLDEIFGSRPALEAEGVDVAEMDWKLESIEIESLPVGDEELCQSQTAEENISDESEPEQKLRSFKRTKKQSYQKVVESFSKEWKESQQDLLEKIKEHDREILKEQKRDQEELLGKSMEAMEEILAKDREETAKMLQNFFTASQPMQPTIPYVFHAPNSAFMVPSSPNATGVPVPKLSPQDSNSAFL